MYYEERRASGNYSRFLSTENKNTTADKKRERPRRRTPMRMRGDAALSRGGDAAHVIFVPGPGPASPVQLVLSQHAQCTRFSEGRCNCRRMAQMAVSTILRCRNVVAAAIPMTIDRA